MKKIFLLDYSIISEKEDYKRIKDDYCYSYSIEYLENIEYSTIRFAERINNTSYFSTIRLAI
jgi:hypothetical protein